MKNSLRITFFSAFAVIISICLPLNFTQDAYALTSKDKHTGNSSSRAKEEHTSNPSPIKDKIPTILVNGAFSKGEDLLKLEQSLKDANVPVYSKLFRVGKIKTPYSMSRGETVGGVQDINKISAELAAYIEQVKKETGSDKVNLVGHSLGSLVIKNYMAKSKSDDVNTVVSLAGNNHGSTLGKFSKRYNLLPGPIRFITNRIGAALISKSAVQALAGSTFIKKRNATPDTKPGVKYLVLISKDDNRITPYQSSFLKPAKGADVINMEVHNIPGVDTEVTHAGSTGITENKQIVAAVTKYIATNSYRNAGS